MWCTPVDGLLGLRCGLHHELVVVLVLEVPRLVGAESGQGIGDRRRLKADRGDDVEINCVGHGLLPLQTVRTLPFIPS
jgi:hypothetical protein